MENKEKFISIGFWGSPNSGKSTLFNALLDKHVAIVSDKPQTTEKITDATINFDEIAINLMDTPGISFKKTEGRRGVLNKMSWEEVETTDYLFFLVPSDKPYIHQEFIDRVQKAKKNFGVIITKMDRIKQEFIPSVIQKIQDLYNPNIILCCSAKYGKGVYEVLNYFLSLPHRVENLTHKDHVRLDSTDFLSEEMKKGGPSTFVNISNEELSKDMTREAIFQIIRNEVPYRILVENVDFKETLKNIQIEQRILVPNLQYKLILFGNDNLNNIRKLARKSLEDLTQKNVGLKYIIKVQK